MFREEYVTLVDSMGNDLTTVNSARVSFAKESEWEIVDHLTRETPIKKLSEKDTKLINYLAKNGHWTPFSQNAITLRIKMPIFVRSQWFKHTIGFSRNEVSRRYVSDKPEFWTPTEWRKASSEKKQGSSDEIIDIPIEVSYLGEHPYDYQDIVGLSAKWYDEAIQQGVAPEQARIMLPQSMMTEFVETASLAAYGRLAKLRLDSHAQSEIRDYAAAVSKIMAKLFPVSWKALMEN